MGTSDILSITTKLEVGSYILILKVGWRSVRPVFVDIKITVKNGFFRHGELSDVVALRSEHLRSANASMELICRQASLLMESGVWGLKELCEHWRGTQVFYGGAVPSLPYYDGCIQQVATGTLDAAARLIELRVKGWNEKMRDEEQIEHMIEACLQALNEDETIFSSWEQIFLEDIENVNDFKHLTDKQIAKLEQIYEDKICS